MLRDILSSSLKSMIESSSDLKILFDRHEETAIRLLKEDPKLANFMTFEILIKCHVMSVVELLQMSGCRRVIDTPEKVLRLSKKMIGFDIDSTLTLFLNDQMVKKAMATLPLVAFNHLVHRLGFEKHVERKDIPYLDLATMPYTGKQNLWDDRRLQELALDKYVLKTFPTVKNYFKQMMYGPSGYYTKGKANFSIETFNTYATDPDLADTLAAAIAYQIFSVWQNLLKNKILKKSDRFNILECGAGNGALCSHIFQIMDAMAKQDPEWKVLADGLHYHIIEISPALIDQQKEKLKSYSKRVSIHAGDASTIAGSLPKMIFIYSIELLDELEAQAVLINKVNEVVIRQIAPLISEQNFIVHFSKQFPTLDFKELKKESNGYAKLLPLTIGRFKCPLNHLILSEKTFLKLHEFAVHDEKLNACFTMVPFAVVPSHLDLETTQFLQRNPNYMQNKRWGDDTRGMGNLEIRIYPYLQKMQALLMKGGEIMTMDYGDTFYKILEIYKIVAGAKKGNDIFEKPGRIDISHEVNLSTIADEGVKVGLNTTFCGTLDQLKVDAFPDAILSSKQKQEFNKISRAGNFKVILQHRQFELKYDDKQLAARFNGQSMAVYRSQLDRQYLDGLFSIARLPHIRLYQAAKAICDKNSDYKSIIIAIKNTDYGMALRKSAAAGSLTLVTLLLDFKKAIALNVNETSSSNGYTAYDWAKEAKINPLDKHKIITKLEEEGGKSGLKRGLSKPLK